MNHETRSTIRLRRAPGRQSRGERKEWFNRCLTQGPLSVIEDCGSSRFTSGPGTCPCVWNIWGHAMGEPVGGITGGVVFCMDGWIQAAMGGVGGFGVMSKGAEDGRRRRHRVGERVVARVAATVPSGTPAEVIQPAHTSPGDVPGWTRGRTAGCERGCPRSHHRPYGGRASGCPPGPCRLGQRPHLRPQAGGSRVHAAPP